MRLFIPELKTLLILNRDWTFRILNERRNTGLAKYLERLVEKDAYYYPFGTRESNNIIDDNWRGHGREPVDPGTHTLLAGTVLEVFCYDIVQGHEDKNTITFKMVSNRKIVKLTVLLVDANTMEL